MLNRVPRFARIVSMLATPAMLALVRRLAKAQARVAAVPNRTVTLEAVFGQAAF
jgi:hypothetical protein